MNLSSKRYAVSILGSTLLTFSPLSHASTLSGVAPESVVVEAVGALAARTLDPSLRAAGSGITDATVTPPSGVPEPETMALLGLGIAALIVSKRREARKIR